MKMRSALRPDRERNGQRWWMLLLPVALGLAETLAGDGGGKGTAAAMPNGTPLAEVTFVAFDTETTGLNPKKDRIVEVGAVKYRNGRIVDQKSWLVNPQRSIPYTVQRIHGITPAMVADKPPFAEVYPELQAFIGDSVLLAHNARFDIGFVAEEVRRCGGRPPTNAVIDSLSLFRKWFPDAQAHSLESLAAHTSIRGEGFHRALADSVYIVLIMDRALQERALVPRLAELFADAGGPLYF